MATTAHKEGKATVKVVYWTYKTLKDGTHPFFLQITKDRKLKRIATGLSLLPAYWDSSKVNGKALDYHQAIRKPTKKLINSTGETIDREKLIAALEAWEAKYSGAATTLAEADEQHDAPAVAAKAIEGRKATRRVLLLAYIAELVETQKKAGQLGNARVYRQTATELHRFIADEYKVEDVPVARVNVSFCNEWEATLRATGAEDTTLSLRFRTLRAVLNKAIASGLAKAEHYPFSRNRAEKHKYNVSKFDLTTRKRAISRAELRLLEALPTTDNRAGKAKDAFLFSYYCGGINFVDLAQLKWQDVSGLTDAQRLHYVRQKTGGKFSLRLLAPAAAILAKYRPETYTGLESYVFPFLNHQKHTTAAKRLVRLQNVLGWVNKNLKLLGEQAGISTPLTTYVARHTFATTMKLGGTSTGLISQAMGHKSEAVTAVYLDSFASDLVDTAFDSLL